MLRNQAVVMVFILLGKKGNFFCNCTIMLIIQISAIFCINSDTAVSVCTYTVNYICYTNCVDIAVVLHVLAFDTFMHCNFLILLHV